MTSETDEQIEDLKLIIERKKSDGEDVEALQATLDALMVEKHPCLEDKDPDDEEEEGEDEAPEEAEKEAEKEPEAGNGENQPDQTE